MTTPQLKRPDPVLAFDTSDPDFIRDPYERYRELREKPELHRNVDGLWVLTRHVDVLAALRDPRLSSNPRHVDPNRRAGAPGGLLANLGVELMLTADAPEHTRLRRLANKAFTPRAVQVLRPRVASLVDRLLDDASDGDGVDFMEAVARPLPVLVICELLGVPIEDRARFGPWSSAIARVVDTGVEAAALAEAGPAVVGFVEYFRDLIDERRADPIPDVLSALVAAEAEGERLTMQELFAMVILLFIAGHETTTNLLGNGVLALLRHREQFANLVADPSFASRATEELLRFDAPVQATVRTAADPLELNGIPLEQGEGVVCVLAAANRDPALCERPDELRIDRDAVPHVAFGGGMHHCLGAALARLEGQVVFERLARRFPGASLEVGDPPYRDNFVLRGLTSLRLQLGPDREERR